ncbi:damage-inducible protein J [Neptunomonas concharum]|uniref:Damage-inducible protein J n=1 Tax=Neptunomonas concharum TaxID=1031538 RepID=A0A5P1RE30_9GAMM|nr:damage-inducible protein J [Neptunomonas concharum]QEQ97516.1 damage-inducible protein J [Neptunomonas concharum]
MDTRIQFRINDEIKRLAQQMAEQQRKALAHDAWLTEQVDLAFKKFNSGEASFIDHDSAKARMAERKAKIRSRS